MPVLTPVDAKTWLAERDTLDVVPLADPLVESLGHDPRSLYAETYWLSVLGPSALLAARRLAAWLEDAPEGFPLPLAPFAAQLGLGAGTGCHAPLTRTLGRLVAFGMAAIQGDAYAVRRAFPPLARRHIARLPAYLAELHQREMEAAGRAVATAGPQAAGAVVALRR